VRFRQLVRGGKLNELATDELLLDLLLSALQSCQANEPLHPSTRRLVDRAKTFLGANFGCLLRLQDVAAAVGASAASLTNAFRRAEGIPLHSYVIQLRLARALVEIPHTTDLTELALQLGFSSHSHFTAHFGKCSVAHPLIFAKPHPKQTWAARHWQHLPSKVFDSDRIPLRTQWACSCSISTEIDQRTFR